MKTEQIEVTADMENQRTRCEVYSRIVGYLRPVNQWNIGKKEEFQDRKTYDKTQVEYAKC
jgi:ribonucleoside-triphosphate reductase